MRTLSVNHFFALPRLLNAVAVVGYVAAVAVLVYAIGIHVQLDAPRGVRYAHASGSAPLLTTGPCADATGIERGLCKADATIDATKAKIKRHLAKRRLQETTVAAESLPGPSYPALMFVRDTLVWAAEQADLKDRGPATGNPIELQHASGPVPPPTPSLRAVTVAGPFARH